MNLRHTWAALAAILTLSAVPAIAADNYVVKNGAGADLTIRSKDTGSGIQAPANAVTNAAGTIIDPATSTKQPALGTAGSSSTDVLSVQGIASGTALPVSAASLPLPSGAATEASLAKLPVAQGSATSGQSNVLGACAVTTAAPSYTTTQTSPLSCDTSGNLRTTSSGGGGGAATIANGADVTQGAQADAICATAITTCSVMSDWKYLLTQQDTLVTAATDVTTPRAVNPKPAADMGCSITGLVTAATTNATNIKPNAGTLCGGTAVNPTATLEYLRFFNIGGGAPTCSSGTGFVVSLALLPNDTTPLNLGALGAYFGSGIGYCVTANAASNDNNASVAGITLLFTYK